MSALFKDDFKLFGLKKSEFEEKCASSGIVGFEASETEDVLDLKASYETDKRDEKYDFDIKSFLKVFGSRVYAYRDVSLKEQLFDLLKLNGCKLSAAESFTGGNVAATVISVSGASKIFYEGIVAYDCDAKVKRLGVKSQTLAKCKAVSAEVAREMAEGLIKSGKCDVAVSTTGLAGPESDDSGFPVGRCYIGVSYLGETEAFEYNFKGDRSVVIKSGVNAALFEVIKNIQREVNLC